MIMAGWGALAIWVLLLATGFWTTRERDDAASFAAPATWPDVVAVVPARDEADVIARSLGSLIAQDYPGSFRIVLVDDNSTDGTAMIARALRARFDPPPLGEVAARRADGGGGLRNAHLPANVSLDTPSVSLREPPPPGGEDLGAELRHDVLGPARVTVIGGAPLPVGWTGKLWALHQGIDAAGAPTWLWLTDADIEHAPDTLRQLVGIAYGAHTHGKQRKLVSFMALLHCRTWPERMLVPAFIYFFKLVYPFGWINRPGPFAGAAGGCVLVERGALAAAGGVGAMRGALIDDCTLGRLIKRQGPIWLGLTRRSRSIRPYVNTGEIGAMIARSAYAQLRYSPVLLVGTVAGLALVFGLPVALVLTAQGLAWRLGALATVLMVLSWQPVLAWYRRSPLWGLVLPLVAAFYAGCTLASALAWYRGRGGMWKGRAQAVG
ncbi:MAG: glycosyltransferase [Pseudomonadota bacterium]|nr:glycosyltransferase [Pseudomonadota bacterium]